MNHRIRAAGIAVENEKILLIKHVYDSGVYWLPPGGGLEATDGSTTETVRRELSEESGLQVEVGSLLFVREFFETSKNTYHVELFYLLTSWSGELSLRNLQGLGGDEHIITEARWVSRHELQSLNVYPVELKDLLWQKLNEPDPTVEHLGVQAE